MEKVKKDIILVADNNIEWFNMIKCGLGDVYKITYAANFRELYKKILKEKPNIVLTDSIYEDRSNQYVKLLEAAIKNKTLIILFTAGDTSANKLHRLGAIDCITKPSSPKGLDLEKVSKKIELYISKSKYERIEQENQKLKEKLKYDTSPIIVDSLKRWMKRYPDVDRKIISYGLKGYSVNQLIEEIDKRGEIGNSLLKAWIDLIIRMALKDNNKDG